MRELRSRALGQSQEVLRVSLTPFFGLTRRIQPLGRVRLDRRDSANTSVRCGAVNPSISTVLVEARSQSKTFVSPDDILRRMTPPGRRPSPATLAAFAAVVVIGSPVFVAVRYSNEELPPFWGAAVRFGPAALLFIALAAAMRLRAPRGRALVGDLLYGVLGFGASYVFGYWALVSLPASLAAVMVALVPLLTFFAAAAHRVEPLRWQPVIGGSVAVAGIMVIVGQQLSAAVSIFPLLALLAALVCIAETSVVLKLFPTSHPVTSNAVGMATGTAILLAMSLLTREAWSLPTQPVTWLSLSYLILGAGVLMFWLYVYVVTHWSASASSYGFVLTPLLAIPIAAWLAGEAITLLFVAGAALVLFGVYIGTLFGAARQRERALGTG